jgi:hypothetical protein
VQGPKENTVTRIIAIKKDKPDLDLFVAALLAFTIKQLEAEKAAAAGQAKPKERRD